MAKAYARSLASLDGNIVTVVATDLGNAVTRYTYFNLASEGFKHAALNHIITATTLTIESCNAEVTPGSVLNVTCSGTDGTGADLVATTLNTTHGYAADDDMIGLRVEVTADTTTPANVGEVRTIVDYAQATGTATLDAVLGSTTANVTQFKVLDSQAAWGPLVNDPSDAQWIDVTDLLTGNANATATGSWAIDTPIFYNRLRVKRVTTNATNALILSLVRGR